MDVFLLTTEESSDGWGKPIQVFTSQKLATDFCIEEIIDFVRKDKCDPILETMKIDTRKDKNSIYISISIEGKDKEEDYSRRFGLDRYLYKMKLKGDNNGRTKN